MTAILNNMWWKVLSVHVLLVLMFWGGFNGLAMGILLSIGCGVAGWFTARKHVQKKNKHKCNRPIVFRG
jgi:uncharacterized membrane-anchored protein YitT (DUF2179 family)